MERKLIRHGDDLALLIDRPLLEKLNIDADTSLEISTDGQALIVTPIRDETRKAAFEASIEQMDRQYGAVFKRLAE